MSAAEKFKAEHPRGTSFLARDTPENRHLFPNGPFGSVDIAETECWEDPDTGDQKCPHYNYREDAHHEGALQTPIHLLIASFRDRLCPRTLHNAFTHAENPHRLWIRIIDQTQPDSELVDDAGCWTRYCEEYNTNCSEFKDHVYTIHVDASKAKGPTDARSKLSALVNWDYVHRHQPDELVFHPVEEHDFCMQTDSHMDFSDRFDTRLVGMFHRTENDYAVLSTYVTDIEKNNQDVKTVPNLCMVTFTSTIRNWGTKECKHLVRPKLTNMWGAGLSFHRCHAELNVPVDPYLDDVFDGEEGSRAIRFFTHGYDTYTPDEVLVTHDYHNHQGNPVVHTWGGKLRKNGNQIQDSWKWTKDIEREKPKLKTFGTKRVNMMLGIGYGDYSPKDDEETEFIRSGRYGIGTKRTLEQAAEFTGIDLKHRRMVENKCGNLIWIPYEESEHYGLEEHYRRGLAGGLADDAESLALGGVAKPAVAVPQAAIPHESGDHGPDPWEKKPMSALRKGITKVEESEVTTFLYVSLGGFVLLIAVLGRTVFGGRRRKGERHKD